MISWFQHPLMFGPYNFDNVEALPADNKAEENKMSSTSTKIQPAVEDQWVIFYDWIRAKGLKVFNG